MQETPVTHGKIQNRCPIDLRPLPPVRVSTKGEIEAVIIRARAAQPQWENLGLNKRATLMKQAGRCMLERRQEVLELLHDEAGKTLADMLLSEAVGPLQYIKDWIRIARPYLRARKLPISPLAFPGKRGVTEMLPRGVVGVIAPWNFPLGNFFKPVFAALLCGNTVVIKPSEYSPLTAEWFVNIFGEFLPTDVLGIVHGDREVGQTLIQSGVDAVTFTGSFHSGREVARLAAEQMIPCSVELGGKDAAIVLSDCDLDRTIAGVMHWTLQNSGQACGDIERVYVEDSIADQFVLRLAASVSRLRLPPPLASKTPQPTDLGPVVNAKQFAIIQEHVSDAVSQGAKLIYGGKPAGKGLSFEPTVLDYCNHSMKVLREPTFGPVIPIVRVKDAEEAITLANDCEYGLNASVWSRDLKRGEEIARRLQVGTAFVNNHAFTGAVPAAPWTGVKRSGHGIANSSFALGHYTRPRTLVIDRKKSADAWWFPMDFLAQELGHCLAEAQLGKISSALKLPGLIARRQRRVIQLVRGSLNDASSGDRPRGWVSKFLSRLKNLSIQVGKHAIPPLTRRELAWGQSAIEAIFSGARSQALQPLPSDQTRPFLKDLYRHMPFPANLVMRANFWIVGLAPLFKRKGWRTLEHLSVEERLEVLKDFIDSESYLQRQVAILLKMNGALLQVSTTRFHQATLEVAHHRSHSSVHASSSPSPQTEL